MPCDKGAITADFITNRMPFKMQGTLAVFAFATTIIASSQIRSVARSG